jgi:hypothetical protein
MIKFYNVKYKMPFFIIRRKAFYYRFEEQKSIKRNEFLVLNFEEFNSD